MPLQRARRSTSFKEWEGMISELVRTSCFPCSSTPFQCLAATPDGPSTTVVNFKRALAACAFSSRPETQCSLEVEKVRQIRGSVRQAASRTSGGESCARRLKQGAGRRGARRRGVSSFCLKWEGREALWEGRNKDWRKERAGEILSRGAVAWVLCCIIFALGAEGGGQIKVNRAPAGSLSKMPRAFSGKAKKEQMKAKKASKRSDDADAGGDDVPGWGRRRLTGLAGLKAAKPEAGGERKVKAFGGGGGGGRPPKGLSVADKFGIKNLKTVFEREPQVQHLLRPASNHHFPLSPSRGDRLSVSHTAPATVRPTCPFPIANFRAATNSPLTPLSLTG